MRNQTHLERLEEAKERFIQITFPSVRGVVISEQLRKARSDLIDVDHMVAGCVYQLLYLDEQDRDLNLCRRVLNVDEDLTNRIRFAPDDSSNLVKAELLAYKKELDHLIRLAQLALKDFETENQ